jgi:hypothetical protein
MSDVFYLGDVLGDLAAIRAILRLRAQRIIEAGGDARVTEGHIAALERLEHLLCGTCNIAHVRIRLGNYEARGQVSISHAELFKLLHE